MIAEGIHPVSSKEHMLSPTDIFVVAAHEDKYSQKALEQAAKKGHVSNERMLYAFMIEEYSNKGLIRIREGNTLFTIAAMEGRVGYVKSYNGDTAKNFIENMHQFMLASRILGFDFLIAFTHTKEIVTLLKLAAKKINYPQVKTHFDSSNGVFTLCTGKQRP
jgi:hypothetical protein